MTNTNHGLVKTAPARELAFFGAHINLHYLFVLYAGVSMYIYGTLQYQATFFVEIFLFSGSV